MQAHEPPASGREERFMTYSLSGLLPEGQTLVADAQLRILSLLGESQMIEQQHLTDNEYFLVMELLASYPYHCPLEQLLSTTSGRSLSRCREQVMRALEEGSIDFLMRPTRNLLSRCRVKLHPFGIDIRSIIGTGYQLLPDTVGRGSRRKRESW